MPEMLNKKFVLQQSDEKPPKGEPRMVDGVRTDAAIKRENLYNTLGYKNPYKLPKNPLVKGFSSDWGND